MTPADLDAVAAQYGVRLQWLISDLNADVAQRDAYRALVAGLASGDPPPAAPAFESVPLPETVRALKLGYSNCWFSAQDDECGCSGVRCHLLGRIVSLRDCVDCLKS